MILRRLERNQSVKVRIDGRDKHGKNTTRGMVVLDATLEEVEAVIRKALEAESLKSRGKGEAMTKPEECKHLTLNKLAPDSPANGLHQGPDKAFHCHECGSTFFVNLIPTAIKVSYGKQEREVRVVDSGDEALRIDPSRTPNTGAKP